MGNCLMFARLVNDASDAGAYCSDEDLDQLLANLQTNDVQAAQANEKERMELPDPSTVAQLPRKHLIREVFRAFDTDFDGKLRVKEMQRFAECTGFDGTQEDWRSAYEEGICEENDIKPAEGVSEAL